MGVILKIGKINLKIVRFSRDDLLSNKSVTSQISRENSTYQSFQSI